MASDTTTANFIYKRKYSDKRPAEEAMRFHPSLQEISKKDGFVGHDTQGTFFYSVRTGNPQGVSQDFDAAQGISDSASNGASVGEQFGAQRQVKYGIIRLDGQSLNAARGNEGAFIDLVSLESQGIFEEVGDTLAFELQRDGTGVRGQRASLAGNVVTLAVADNARNFKRNMVVVAGPNADGSGLRAGSTFVVALDEDAGTIELDNAGDITGFADDDFLFRIGDAGLVVVDGFESIIPLTAPGPTDDFRNVNRSGDTRRLAGSRVNDTASSIEENAGLVATKIRQTGGRANRLILNPIRFWEVIRRFQGKVYYAGAGGKVGYGFEAFDIVVGGMTLQCISDPDAPVDRGRVLNSETWTWKYLTSPWIHPIRDDNGNFFLRKPSADAIEGRVRTMGNVICWKPRDNGTFAI